MKIYKSIFSLMLIIFTATIIGWGVWKNYRPTIVMASCGDIAQKTTILQKRYNIDIQPDTFDDVFQKCVNDADITR